jgi:hypothetical protein
MEDDEGEERENEEEEEEEERDIPKRPQPDFPTEPERLSDKIIRFLRSNTGTVWLYMWLTDTLVPLVLAVVIVVPVGAVQLLFYLPKFYRNRKRQRDYGVEVIPLTEKDFISEAELKS